MIEHRNPTDRMVRTMHEKPRNLAATLVLAVTPRCGMLVPRMVVRRCYGYGSERQKRLPPPLFLAHNTASRK